MESKQYYSGNHSDSQQENFNQEELASYLLTKYTSKISDVLGSPSERSMVSIGWDDDDDEKKTEKVWPHEKRSSRKEPTEDERLDILSMNVSGKYFLNRHAEERTLLISF